jgi:hypothetical protein
MNLKNCSIIISPHPDDELIGTFEILNNDKQKIIIYDKDISKLRKSEAVKLKQYFPQVINQEFLSSIPKKYLSKDTTYYFPDPVNEVHPKHRFWGNIGEILARDGFDIIFYSTIMNVPWIHEVQESKKKLLYLNLIYKSQRSLWKYEHKYFLWEARYKWIF